MSSSNAGSTRNAGSGARRFALRVLFVATLAIAAGYASAFSSSGAPAWGAWCLALGVPASLGAIMMLGAVRGSAGLGRLKLPIAFVTLLIATSFSAALALPATDGVHSRLFGGLPLRAAIIIYGVGLLPIIVLPVAYALTFAGQTLDEADIERVREMGREFRRQG